MATNKVTTNVIDMSGNTGGLVWAKGTTAQRPGAPVAGDTRYNTDDNKLEYYDGTSWVNPNESAATPTPDFSGEYLVVAGGGGSASRSPGGGGAGGVLENFSGSPQGFYVSTNYTVTVGSGGAGGAGGGNNDGNPGSDSVFGSFTAIGGGQSNLRGTLVGGNGGSGGGASEYGGDPTTGGNGTAGQGFDGGDSSFDGSSGGGGGARGRNGSEGTNVAGISGASNTGGGAGGGAGGGTSSSHAAGGNGGSGIVILKYPNTYTISVGAGLTSSTTTDGSYKITSFTAGSDTVSFS